MTYFILGIESSCDETSVAIISSDKKILGHIILSQTYHADYGGVVPEIAARAHMDHLDHLIIEALTQSGLKFSDLSAIAATCGPGLIGGVLVGAMMAKAIAYAHQLPFIAINHLEGHALSVRLTENVPFPYMLLLMSGGHTQFLLVEDIGHYTLYGTTLDDAIGEAFDKTAKILGLPYPGGMYVEQYALSGNPRAFHFPRPLKGNNDCNFSFSGLKTAIKYKIDSLEILDEQTKANLCASFQQATLDVLIDRTKNACQKLIAQKIKASAFVVAGGVAANMTLKTGLSDLVSSFGLPFVSPPKELCTDNGAMIAYAGLERFQKGYIDSLNFKPRPRWPLIDLKTALATY